MPETPRESDADFSPAQVAEETLFKLAPWGLSALLHAGVLLVSVFLVWSTAAPQGDDSEIIIPFAGFGKYPGGDLALPSNHARTPVAVDNAAFMPNTRRVSRDLTGLRVGGPSSVGTGAGAGEGRGEGQSVGPGQGSGLQGFGAGGLGNAGGEGGKGSPFGNGLGGGGDSFPSVFGGMRVGNAKKVVYVIDASGSLIDTIDYVILDLKRAVADLVEPQSFTVIFFQGGEVIEPAPTGLKKATHEHKQRIIRWIDVKEGNIVPAGRTTPVAAIQKALAYKPDLIYLLSDDITGTGAGEIDQKRLLAAIDKVNTRPTKINTIQFIYPDPLTRYGLKGTMQQISERSGGMHAFITAQDLEW